MDIIHNFSISVRDGCEHQLLYQSTNPVILIYLFDQFLVFGFKHIYCQFFLIVSLLFCLRDDILK